MIAALRKDTAEAMIRMKDLLSSHGYRRNIITVNTFFIYDPQNNRVVNAMESFWNEYLDRRITYRDQPLWALIRQQHHLSYYSFKHLKFYFIQSKILYNHVYA
jgi:enamine deaminase RidA (YjgF/YER057c/UK114 family)